MGATAKSILQREDSRFRKFQQILRSQHAYFEPAFDYWHRTNTYWLFTPLEITLVPPGSKLWAGESTWQYTLKPQLNAPCIHRILARMGFHEHLTDFRQNALRAPTSLTLFKRLQRRLRPVLPRRVHQDPRQDVQHQNEMLHRLGSNTGASYHFLRELRSVAFPVAAVLFTQTHPLRVASYCSPPFGFARILFLLAHSFSRLLYVYRIGRRNLVSGSISGFILIRTVSHHSISRVFTSLRLVPLHWGTSCSTIDAGNDDSA